jgi:hypothetical protein
MLPAFGHVTKTKDNTWTFCYMSQFAIHVLQASTSTGLVSCSQKEAKGSK